MRRDDVREKSFSKKSRFRLLTKGTKTVPASQIITILNDRYGADEELFEPNSTPSMVLCSMHAHNLIDLSGVKSGVKNKKIEPLILRTYAYPGKKGTHQADGVDDEFNDSPPRRGGSNKVPSIAVSTNTVTLCEGMAATSTVPGLFDRIKLKIGGHERSIADGFLLNNSPVALAIVEAMKIYPGRPIGVVLNFGFGESIITLDCLKFIFYVGIHAYVLFFCMIQW